MISVFNALVNIKTHDFAIQQKRKFIIYNGGVKRDESSLKCNEGGNTLCYLTIFYPKSMNFRSAG